MKKNIIRTTDKVYHFLSGEQVVGPNIRLSGNYSGLSGNCSYLSGDLDECEISDTERHIGINIIDLVKEVKP